MRSAVDDVEVRVDGADPLDQGRLQRRGDQDLDRPRGPGPGRATHAIEPGRRAGRSCGGGSQGPLTILLTERQALRPGPASDAFSRV